MIGKDALRALETGALAEIGLIAFFIAFLLVIAYAFLMTKKQRDDAKQLPLEDDEVINRRQEPTDA